MDPFRNGTDKKRFLIHIFVFFSTCKSSLFFQYRSVTFFLSYGAPRQLFSLRAHITEFVRVNRRFGLEPVLVSNRAVPSLLTCKQAYRKLRINPG